MHYDLDFQKPPKKMVVPIHSQGYAFRILFVENKINFKNQHTQTAGWEILGEDANALIREWEQKDIGFF